MICNTIVCWPAVAQLHEAVDTYWYVHESELIREFVENIPEFAALLKKGMPIWADSRLASRFLSMYAAAHCVIEYGIEDHLVGYGRAPTHDAEKVVIGVFGTYERRKGQDLAVGGMLRLPHELQMRAELRFLAVLWNIVTFLMRIAFAWTPSEARAATARLCFSGRWITRSA